MLRLERFGDDLLMHADGRPVKVGVLCGADEVRTIVNDRSLAVPVTGNTDVCRLLDMLDRGEVAWRRLHVTPNQLKSSGRFVLSGFDVLWNLITDPDLNPKTLAVAERVARASGLPVLNAPGRMVGTRRHEIAARLAAIPMVHAPKVVHLKYPSRARVEAAVAAVGLQFPAILRRSGTHNGEVVGVLKGLDEMEPIFGDRRRDYYLTEFVDVRRADRLYRKTRFFFVGDAIILRQHIIAAEWSIHGRSSRSLMVGSEPLLAESRAMLLGGFDALPEVTQTALRAIRARIGLDFCGLDCYLDEGGGVVVFELNATMSFNPAFRNPKTQHNRAALPPMLAALRTLIVERARRATAA